MARLKREYAPEVVQISVQIPQAIDEALVLRAVAYRSSKAKIIRDILIDYVSSDKTGKAGGHKWKR